jgi:hypothetical protein
MEQEIIEQRPEFVHGSRVHVSLELIDLMNHTI